MVCIRIKILELSLYDPYLLYFTFYTIPCLTFFIYRYNLKIASYKQYTDYVYSIYQFKSDMIMNFSFKATTTKPVISKNPPGLLQQTTDTRAISNKEEKKFLWLFFIHVTVESYTG